jgi:hypothetical protein
MKLLPNVILCSILWASQALQAERGDKFCRALYDADKMSNLNRGFAALWLGEKLEEANQLVSAAYVEVLAGAETMTPEIADERAKWQMRTWVRMYYLFSDRSEWFPNRLDTGNREKVGELLWNYGYAKSFLERTDPKYVWFIQGSENHDLMDLGNAYLALQAIADRPEYSGRALADGHSLKEHIEAWANYFKSYCEERMRKGLFIEVASPIYGKYLIPELTNLYDFTSDRELKAKVEALLHLTWADWAVEQLDGVRGGAKARCYQGKYSQDGDRDSYKLMGEILLERGGWADPARHAHPTWGFGLALATSAYRLPDVVRELALRPEDRGEYVYVSRRPGKMKSLEALPPVGGQACWYNMDATDSKLVRYTWCTPDHVMGSFFVDPQMREAFNVLPHKPGIADNSYAAISAQNRWQGIVFATGPDARVYPQCFGKPDEERDPGLSVTYVQQVAVQHENVSIVQMNRNNPELTKMRVYFAPGMKERLRESEGIFLLEEGDSYLAVRFVSSKGGTLLCGSSWEGDSFLIPEDPFAAVVFVTGRKATIATVGEFEAYVLSHGCNVAEKKLKYTFNDLQGQASELKLYLDGSRLPEKNGAPIDLAPEKVYDCPFIQSDTDSNAVEIRFQRKRITLSF